MQRPCAPHGHKGKTARINPFLQRAAADGIGHVGVQNCEHALGRIQQWQAKSCCKGGYHTFGGSGVQLHRTTQKIARQQTAQHNIGVRDRRQITTAPIGGRPW